MNTNQEIALAILAAFVAVGILTLIAGYLAIGIAWQEYADVHRREAGTTGEMPSGWTLVARAARRRCPNCGQGPIFKSYFVMNPACPACSAVFRKHEGEWLGPAVIDYSVAVGGALISWAILVFFGCSITLQAVIPAVIAIAGSVATAPWSRSFWTLFIFLNGEVQGTQSHSD